MDSTDKSSRARSTKGVRRSTASRKAPGRRGAPDVLIAEPGPAVTDAERDTMRARLDVVASMDPTLWRSLLGLTAEAARAALGKAAANGAFVASVARRKALTEPEFQRVHALLAWDPPVFIDGTLQPVTVGGRPLDGAKVS